MASIRTQWQFRTYCRAGVPFLMFHKIGKCPASASMPWLYVSPIQFQRLLDGFKCKDLQSISIGEAFQTGNKTGNRFVISFDVGYEGALIFGAQALRDRVFTTIKLLVSALLSQPTLSYLALVTHL